MTERKRRTEGAKGIDREKEKDREDRGSERY